MVTMSLINDIEILYRDLPQLDCKQCGLCCVSPTCTLSEFIYLANYLQKNFTREKLIKYLSMPVKPHPDYDGNIYCIFLKKNCCTVHPGRPGACRLFGIPSLKELGISNMEDCKNGINITEGRGDISFINSWLEKLFGLDERLYSFNSGPYYIKGFNIQCWFDIYFDESFDTDVFSEIKAAMNQNFDLSHLALYYTPKTGLKEKIDKISIVSSLIGSGEKGALLTALNSIKNDYPLTGTYFYHEAEQFLQVLNQSK